MITILSLISVLAAGVAPASPSISDQPAGQAVCTEMGCVDGLTLQVDPNYKWQPGKYAFDFVLDGKRVHCDGVLPLKSCEQESVVCSSKQKVMITQNGCALPPEAQGFGDINLGDNPASVSVKITRNGQTIADGALNPLYRTTQPNGPGCEPVCKQATVPLPLK